MSDPNKTSPSSTNSVVIGKDSGRSLPVTSTATPMPPKPLSYAILDRSLPVTSTATPMPPVKQPKPAKSQQKK